MWNTHVDLAMGLPRPFVSHLDIDRLSGSSPAELYDYAWNTSLYHLFTKTLTGLGIGVVLSVLLFKRRTWPVAFGTGTGLGIAYSEANHNFWLVERKLSEAARQAPL